jgi:uncharacterized protein (DUF983 family)
MRRLSAIVRQRCPACRQGQVFRSTFRTLPACQLCGHRFEPFPGAHRGALGAGAAVSLVLCMIVGAAMWHWLVPDYGRAFAILSAAFLWLLVLPAVIRYARIVHMHLEVRALERAFR